MKKLLVAGLVLSVAGGAFASAKTPDLGRTARADNTTLTSSTGQQAEYDGNAPFAASREAIAKEAAPVVEVIAGDFSASRTPIVKQGEVETGMSFQIGSSIVFDTAEEAEYNHLKQQGQHIPESLRLAIFGERGTAAPSRQGGENMDDAVEIAFTAGGTYSDSGTTIGYADDLPSNQVPSALCNTSFYSSSFGGPDVYYTFTLPASYEVSASTCSTAEYDTCLGIFTADGTMVAVNDDGAGCSDWSSLLEECCLPAGTYYLVVDSYSFDEGAYDLTVTFGDAVCTDPCDDNDVVCEGDDEAEPNNGPVDFGGDDTFGAIDCDGVICGTTWADGGTRDTDWFELVLLENTILTVESQVEDFDALMFILDSTYGIVATGNENGICEGETLVSNCLFPGTYYIWMGSATFEGVPDEQNYELTVSCAPCDIDDPCDDPVVLECGDNFTGSTVGNINYVGNAAGDYFFQFNATEEGPVTFDLCDGGTDYDSNMSLWDDCPISGGVMITSNDDACGLQSQIDAVVSPGTYWLVVEGYSANEGNFSLNVTCSTCDPVVCDGDDEGEPNNGPVDFGGDDTYGVIDCDGVICGTTWADGGTRDTDWFELTLTENTIIDVSSEIEAFDGLMFLLDSAFNIVITADDNGICAGESFTSNCLFPGTYYVWMGVNGFEGVPDEQSYSIDLTCTPCDIDDPCEDPVVLGCGDSYTGSTVGMFNYVNNASGDYFFQIDISEAGPVTFSLCDGGTDYDSYLSLWDDCPISGGVMIASNDDACGLQSELVSALDAGTYWLVVDGFSSSEGNFSLVVNCSTCEPVECDGDDEGEPNNGPVDFGGDDTFGAIDCGQTICGTTWADGGTRDTDWFELFLLNDSYVTITSEIEMFDGLVFILDDAYNVITVIDEMGMCEGESYDGAAAGDCLTAGIYYVWMGHNGFEGIPDEQNYALTVDCTDCDWVDPCEAAIPVGCNELVMGSNEDSQAGDQWQDYCNGGEDGPEVIYELTHGGGFLTINLTSGDATDLDLVLLGSCDPLDCLAMPWAVGPNESISGVYDAGTYYIVVDAYGYLGEDYTFTLETICGDDPCEGLPPVNCDGTAEVEPNEGWNDDPPNNSYGDIVLEETICGTVWADGGNRDLDWYRYEHLAAGDLHIGAIIGEFDAILFLTDFDPAGAVIASVDAAPRCEPEFMIAENLPAGIYYVVIAHNAFETVPEDQDYALFISANDVDVAPNLVGSFQLEQNYPNPFNPTTTIAWTQPELTKASLTVFNILGEKVRTYDLGSRPAGVHSFIWDASDLSSGVYIYTLTAGDFTDTRKAVLLK